ncbi:hypothetical protein [Paenibacillus monticola]|uniref:Uncharacterized protein n=1 Tax=Paenibacillus monticola TaxID=2666075 RepID=A0A7X2H1P9_9BACL|nr:hypothetical protein [Paenibacillus monticola]MRN51959.1 hypothetical protein [Paenibacillus monticola]
MAKRAKSARRTELRQNLRKLYLDQSVYLLTHRLPSTAINFKIAKAKSALAVVDKASIYVELPKKKAKP